jgi:hypothetical protein
MKSETEIDKKEAELKRSEETLRKYYQGTLSSCDWGIIMTMSHIHRNSC